jgi:hypothetical protein
MFLIRPALPLLVPESYLVRASPYATVPRKSCPITRIARFFSLRQFPLSVMRIAGTRSPLGNLRNRLCPQCRETGKLRPLQDYLASGQIPVGCEGNEVVLS